MLRAVLIPQSHTYPNPNGNRQELWLQGKHPRLVAIRCGEWEIVKQDDIWMPDTGHWHRHLGPQLRRNARVLVPWWNLCWWRKHRNENIARRKVWLKFPTWMTINKPSKNAINAPVIYMKFLWERRYGAVCLHSQLSPSAKTSTVRRKMTVSGFVRGKYSQSHCLW